MGGAGQQWQAGSRVTLKHVPGAASVNRQEVTALPIIPVPGHPAPQAVADFDPVTMNLSEGPGS